MELARRFLVTGKRRDLLRLPYPCASFSWEEKAFEDDTTGILGGGAVWPPRSYSCSFCDREFRSAQALGGHMNVHRRDRARLKHQNPNFSCPLQPPVQPRASSPSMSGSKEMNRTDDNCIPPHSFCSRSFIARKEDPVCTFDHSTDCDTYLSVGLNKSMRGDRVREIGDDEMNFKRHKISGESSPPLHHLLKECSSSSDDQYNSLQLFSGKMDFMEDDLDLELRLGDPPKVK
ncbi:hypothetical protein SAY87_006874 [Trapa incisa]|uniref:C2H2-type domain-containing protein n=1 Tax=Trapa incisa TaxID=236973 RepID=A0AAN7K0D3_9MYRT|nr:hypothetical protein SAY87_006874 [Trapa incisa]